MHGAEVSQDNGKSTPALASTRSRVSAAYYYLIVILIRNYYLSFSSSRVGGSLSYRPAHWVFVYLVTPETNTLPARGIEGAVTTRVTASSSKNDYIIG